MQILLSLLVLNVSFTSGFYFSTPSRHTSVFTKASLGDTLCKPMIANINKIARGASKLSQYSSLSISTSRLATQSSGNDLSITSTDISEAIIQSNMHKVSIAIAGGGSSAISSLASTPGASSVLLNGNVLYDRLSFCQYVAEHLGASVGKIRLLDDNNQANDVDSSNYNYKNRQNQFGFVSSGAAVLLSKAALHHAFQQSSLGEMANQTLGIGCTSTLVSEGREGRNSRAHVSITSGDGLGAILDIQLSSEGTIAGGNQELERRSRQEEEDLLGQLILHSINQFENSLTSDEISGADDYDLLLHRNGDKLDLITFEGMNHSKDSRIFVENVACKIIDDADDLETTILAPMQQGDSTLMVPLVHTVIPPEPIIFPGSFNPPHLGHQSLANAAIKTMSRKKQEELEEFFRGSDESENGDTMMEDMWKTTDHQHFQMTSSGTHPKKGPFSVLFEMSLTNADKPAMEASEASRRVALFGELFDSRDNAPDDWGVLLTSAPLFIDKVRMMKKYLVPSGATFLPNKRQITFVIGTDTMVRIINPKYYGGEYNNMLKAVREMGSEGVHFVVGGRLEQNKNGSDKFVTGEEELSGLPSDVKAFFTIIQEEDFRVDISSTELRKKNASG